MRLFELYCLIEAECCQVQPQSCSTRFEAPSAGDYLLSISSDVPMRALDQTISRSPMSRSYGAPQRSMVTNLFLDVRLASEGYCSSSQVCHTKWPIGCSCWSQPQNRVLVCGYNGLNRVFVQHSRLLSLRRPYFGLLSLKTSHDRSDEDQRNCFSKNRSR